MTSLRATVWRPTVVACIVVGCAVGTTGAPGALADQSTKPNPEELWRAYPLEQPPTGGGETAPHRPAAPSSTLDAPPTGPSWIAVAAVAASGALVMLMARAVVLRRKLASVPREARSSGNVERSAGINPLSAPTAAPVTSGRPPPRAEHQGDVVARRRAAGAILERPGPAVPAPRSLGTLPQEEDRTSVAEPVASAPPPAAAPDAPTRRAPDDEFVELLTSPGRRFERGADTAQPVKRRATAPSTGEVCQVRWGRRGSRFYAVMIDADAVEHKVARSPRFEWRGPSPPEQSPEAQAALRQLAKELRNRGWKPLRAKGKDFNESQWYARRFRWPATETEDAKPHPSQPTLEIRIVGERAGARLESRREE